MPSARSLFILLLLVSLPVTVNAQPGKASAAMKKSTVTYREVQGHAIQADIIRPDDNSVRPVLVWIHGGALIGGGRESIPPRVTQLATDKQYALIAIDYRLAPETKLPEIISDIEAAFRWIEEKGAKEFHLDPKRIVVGGDSAGGYLTLVTGYRVTPRPKALVAFYGYGDLTGDWYGTPSPHPRHNPLKVSAEDAAKQTDGSVISNVMQRKGNGSLIYLHYRQTGTWDQSVSGFAPGELSSKIAPYEPLRNVTAEYPPTLLIHGDKDTDVPYEQSVMMEQEIRRKGSQATLITIHNGEHGFDGGNAAQIEAAYTKMREFIGYRLDEGN